MRNKLKKFMTISMAGVLACSMTFLSGCGKDNSANEADTKEEAAVTTEAKEDEGKSFEGHTLNVGVWGGNDQEVGALEKMKAEFESRTGATVVFKTYTDYNTQIQADFIAKTAPDTFYIDASMFPFYADLGVMEPLDPAEMGADQYYSNLLDAFKSTDGTLYCIPKDVSTLATYYNKGILDSVGVKPEDIPSALEDYKAFVTDLQAKLDEKYGKGQIAAMTYNPELSREIYVLEAGGASIMDSEGKATMSSDGVVDNLKFLVDLVQTGAVKTPQELGLGWNGEAFGVGKTAIMEEGNWVYGTLKKDFSDIDFGVKDMPTYKGEPHSMAFTVGYGVSSVSEEKDLAKEWIKFATGDEGMKIWCEGAGCLPSRPSVAEAMDVNSDPVWAVHTKMIEVSSLWQKGTTLNIIDSAYKNFVPAVFKGEEDAKAGMEQVDKQANSEIENAQ